MAVTIERPVTRDWSEPSNEAGAQLHSQTLESAAWILHAWPVLREWLPQSFYDRVHTFAFGNWADSAPIDPSPLEIDPMWSPSAWLTSSNMPFKGRHCPGHSILPNLLMHQVALREGRSDAAIYLNAAVAQSEWIVANLDWADPKTTKGQRMSECKLLPGLVYLLRNFPAQAPSGLAAKIDAWVDTMIARSNNSWDFRRYDDTDWAIPKGTPNWNEPGNLAGFPACALSAATVTNGPAKQLRLRQIAWAAMDCLFGRNPLLKASPARPHTLANGSPGGFPDVERGWPDLYTGGVGYLENSRGAICSSPGSEHFPNSPSAARRYYEPWTNFNAAWNMGIAYLGADIAAQPAPLTLPAAYSAAPDADANSNQVSDLIEYASAGPNRIYQSPRLLPGSILRGEVNLQAYDVDLRVEWSDTLTNWVPATAIPTHDVSNQDGTITRDWQLPSGEPKLFWRLRASSVTPRGPP